MTRIQKMLGLLAGLSCTAAMGNNINTIFSDKFFPVLTLQGGYAALNTGKISQQFSGTDGEQFIYQSTDSSKNAGFFGVFLGLDYPLGCAPCQRNFLEFGAEYNYFGNTHAQGKHFVGIEPETFTLYQYRYTLRAQQLLGTIKLFTTVFSCIHPYAELGLGAAFNTAQNFSVVTQETGSINLTPNFDSRTQAQFSYILGLGLDLKINACWKAGLGYRYSNFGTAAFKNGSIQFKNYTYPVAFNLSSKNSAANQLIAHLSYII